MPVEEVAQSEQLQPDEVAAPPPPEHVPIPELDAPDGLYDPADKYTPNTLLSATDAFWKTVAKSARIYPDTVDTSLVSAKKSTRSTKSWRPKRKPNVFADKALELESELIASELKWSPEALALKAAIAKQPAEQQLKNRRFIQSFLTELHLQQLKIGSLDIEFMDFENLRELTLSGNYISDLDNLPFSVEILHASANEISSLPNCEDMTLRHLGLSHNLFTDTSISSLQQSLPFLVSLDLSYNHICDLGAAVSVLETLPALRSLCLMGNPCSLQHGYRQYVLTSLTELGFFDGGVVTHSDRQRDNLASSRSDVDLRLEVRRLVLSRLPPPKETEKDAAVDDASDAPSEQEPYPEPEYGVWIDVAGRRFKTGYIELEVEGEEVDDGDIEEGEFHPMDLKYRAHITFPLDIALRDSLQYFGFVMYLVQLVRFDKEPKEVDPKDAKKAAKDKGKKKGKNDKGKDDKGAKGKKKDAKGGKKEEKAKGKKGDADTTPRIGEGEQEEREVQKEPIYKVLAFAHVKANAFLSEQPVTSLSGKVAWRRLSRLNDLHLTSTQFDPIVNPHLTAIPDDDDRIPKQVAIGSKPPSHVFYEFSLHAPVEPLVPVLTPEEEAEAAAQQGKAKGKGKGKDKGKDKDKKDKKKKKK